MTGTPKRRICRSCGKRKKGTQFPVFGEQRLHTCRLCLTQAVGFRSAFEINSKFKEDMDAAKTVDDTVVAILKADSALVRKVRLVSPGSIK